MSLLDELNEDLATLGAAAQGESALLHKNSAFSYQLQNPEDAPSVRLVKETADNKIIPLAAEVTLGHFEKVEKDDQLADEEVQPPKLEPQQLATAPIPTSQPATAIEMEPQETKTETLDAPKPAKKTEPAEQIKPDLDFKLPQIEVDLAMKEETLEKLFPTTRKVIKPKPTLLDELNAELEVMDKPKVSPDVVPVNVRVKKPDPQPSPEPSKTETTQTPVAPKPEVIKEPAPIKEQSQPITQQLPSLQQPQHPPKIAPQPVQPRSTTPLPPQPQPTMQQPTTAQLAKTQSAQVQPAMAQSLAPQPTAYIEKERRSINWTIPITVMIVAVALLLFYALSGYMKPTRQNATNNPATSTSQNGAGAGTSGNQDGEQYEATSSDIEKVSNFYYLEQRGVIIFLKNMKTIHHLSFKSTAEPKDNITFEVRATSVTEPMNGFPIYQGSLQPENSFSFDGVVSSKQLIITFTGDSKIISSMSITDVEIE